MTAGAPDLALLDFRFKSEQSNSVTRQGEHVSRLPSNVVEVEQAQFGAPAVNTWIAFQVAVGEGKVSRLHAVPGRRRLPPVGCCPSPVPPGRGTPSVAIDAHHLALRDLIPQQVQRCSFLGENRNPVSLRAQMVELEHDRIGLATVCAGMRGEVLLHERSGQGLAPAFRVAGLAPMKSAALPKVVAKAGFAPPLAPAWTATERRLGQVAPALAATQSRTVRSGKGGRRRRRVWDDPTPRHAANPETHRAE